MIAQFERKIDSTSVSIYKSLCNLPHWHGEHELIYVESGSVELTVNNTAYTLRGGECAFVKSGEMHCLRGDMDCVVKIMKASMPQLNEIIGTSSLALPVLQYDYNISGALSDIISEFSGNEKYRDIVAGCGIIRLVAEIFRRERTVEAEQTYVSDDKTKELLAYVAENYNHITFDDAARYMGFSPAYFSRYFKRISTMTFSKYVNLLRVTRAVELIKSGKTNMTDVSISCGFGTIRNFNRIFKELTGYTPKSMPNNYSLVSNLRTCDTHGFDPTLVPTALIESYSM